MLGFFTIYGSGIIATFSLLVSFFNLFISWRARKLAVAQEKRRTPLLIPMLVNAYFQNSLSGTNYAFLVIVNNPTDSNNAVPTVDLEIVYLTSTRFQMTIKLRANAPQAKDFVRGASGELQTPFSLPAHGSITGWLGFHLPDSIRTGIQIERYRVVFTDVHGTTATLGPVLIQEYRDEI